MGQVLQSLQYLEGFGNFEQPVETKKSKNAVQPKYFPDLKNLPPEISLAILSHLNATDLCLAACVWDNLANDEFLWLG